MASGSNQYNAELERQKASQAQLQSMMTAQIQESQKKSPAQLAVEKSNEDWLKFTSDPNRDYAKAPGLVHTGLFNEALQNREDQRAGIGGAALGNQFANPNLVAKLKQQGADRRAERGAIGMANAVQARDASARGETFNATGLDNSLNLGLSNTLSGAYSNANQGYTQMLMNRPQNPIWGILGSAVNGLASNATLAAKI